MFINLACPHAAAAATAPASL